MTAGRLRGAFEAAASDGRSAFVPYMTAGFPDRRAFMRNAKTLLEAADVLEVGLPFSDPLGDGPTIQRSSETALASGVTTQDVLDMVRDLTAETSTPVVIMSYYNPIYCYEDGGEAGFVQAAKAAGAAGLILPDLPPDEGDTLIQAARDVDLDTVFLVAPTSTEERLKRVTDACRGFIYAVSVTGVTGARDALPADVPDLVRRVKAVSDLPVAVGFGVSGAATAKPVADVADGVVVGSAIVKTAGDGGDVAALAHEIRSACVRDA